MMARSIERYVEVRGDGSDPVGSLAARRIPPSLRQWLVEEAVRTNRTQRAVMEDVLEAFVRHRKTVTGRYPYENLPRHIGKVFRMYIRLDLLEDIFEIVEADGIYNGDFVTAALMFERAKDGDRAMVRGDG